MRIVRNIGHVKRRKRLARWSAFLGFVFLISTFPMVFIWGNNPDLILLSYTVLFSGFILFNVGMQQIGKWSNTPRHPRNDLALDARLQSLSDKYVLIHYPRLGKKVVEHLMIHPGGILVITARDYPGKVKARGRRWRRTGLGFTRLFGLSGPQLGNPSLDTDQGIAIVKQVLAEGKLEVDVSGVIVFTSPTVQLDVEDTDYPVLKVEDLPGYVRSLEVDPSIRVQDREALIKLLGKGEELERPLEQRRRRPVRVKRRAA